jgi:hypothetical protein
MQSATAARVVAFGLTALALVVRLGANALGSFNFNPIGALGLFGGARLKSWEAYVLPLGLMIGTDLALAYYKADPEYGLFDPSRAWVYGCYAFYVLLGRCVVGNSKSPYLIGAATGLGALQFFLITNFFEWLRLTDLYSRDFSGLMASYVAAVPFSLNSLAGDVIFTPLAFLVYASLTTQATALEQRFTPAADHN